MKWIRDNTSSSERAHSFTVSVDFYHTNKACSFISGTSDIVEFNNIVHSHLINNPFPILAGYSYPQV